MSEITHKPYDMNIAEADLSSANAWWRNLSLNQMKAYKAEHFPTWQQYPTRRMIHQIWDYIGKPQPQALIPVV